MFRFGNAREAREAVAALPAYVRPGPDGAMFGAGPACHACGNVGANKCVDGTQIVCVDFGACAARYRQGLDAEVFAALLQAENYLWTSSRSSDSVDLVMSGAL